MTNYDDIKPVIFGADGFTKQYDTVLFTGEVYRARVNPKQLKATDKQYDISIKLSKEDYLALKKLKMDTVDKDGNVITQGNRPLTGLKKVELKVKDENGDVELDDEGEEMKEFSHFQITVRQNKQIKGKDIYLPVVMAADNSKVDKFLNEGSKVTVLAQTYHTIFRDKPAMGLNLKEVKVHELVAYEGGSSSGGSSVDPWAALGMTAAEVPSFEEEPSQEAPVEVAGAGNTTPDPDPEPETPEVPNMDEEFEDIPF